MTVVTVTCPKCHQKLEVDIDPSIIENAHFWPVPYGYVHGDPMHVVIIYLDKQFKVRGLDVSEYVRVEAKKETEEKISVHDMIKYMGEYTFTRVLSAIFQGYPVRVDNFNKLHRTLQKLLEETGLKEFTDPQKKKVVWDYITSSLSNVPPLRSKYPIMLVKKLMTLNDDDAMAFLREQAELFRKAKETLDSIKKPINYREARKLLGLGKDPMEVLPYIVIACKAGDKVLRNAELALMESLW